MSPELDQCPDCGHDWRSHRGRNGGERCEYARFDGPCPCRRKNPDIEAEDRLAAALWNSYMGHSLSAVPGTETEAPRPTND